MDAVDQQEVRETRYNDFLIERASHSFQSPAPTGFCLHCGEPLTDSSNPRFCDTECRDEFDKKERRSRNPFW